MLLGRRKKTHEAYTEENKRADGQEEHHVTHLNLHACVPKCYAGLGPFRVPTGFRRLVNEAVKFIGTQLCDLTNGVGERRCGKREGENEPVSKHQI